MTPTLFGRIQTRIFVIAVIGGLWSLIISPLLPGPGSVSDKYAAMFGVLLIVVVLGICWELLYHGLMQLRWEKDWPTLFGLLVGVPEGALALFVARQGVIASTESITLAQFLIGFGTTWLVTWLWVNGPMRVWSLRWRFNGGQVGSKTFLVSLALTGLMGAAVAEQSASAQPSSALATYEVVVTNISNGQPMSGPVLVTHGAGFEAFAVGSPASYGVVQIAENGNNEPLFKQLSYLESQGQVMDVVDYRNVAGSYPGAVPLSARGLPSIGRFPAATKPMTITAGPDGRLSWVSMLVCTNDGFTGGSGLPLPVSIGQEVVHQAVGYATSTEVDNQLLANIMQPCQALSGRKSADGASGQNVSTTAAFPGPGTFPDPRPAGAAAQYPATVEGGFVVEHPGVRSGVGDLGNQKAAPSGATNFDLFRWDVEQPVATISITRVS